MNSSYVGRKFSSEYPKKDLLHGGDIYSRRIDYDFSANINPLGMPKSVVKILAEHIKDFERYPDARCRELKNAIAEHENFIKEKIVCGNGAADLIYRIVYTLNPKTALLAVPTFSEYEKALQSVGCRINYHELEECREFTLTDDILPKIAGNDIMFLCTPNNPTGKIIPRELMQKVIAECSKTGCMLAVDECFMDFTENREYCMIQPGYKNVMILKAFTKIYAMAGLRLGYLLCPDIDLAEKINDCGQCWSVSVPAQMAGVQALAEHDYVEKTVSLISEEREYLMKNLRGFGFKVYDSAANYLLFQCGFPIDEMLLKKGIAIRNCSNYSGLGKGFFRTAVRNHKENEVLVRAIREVLEIG